MALRLVFAAGLSCPGKSEKVSRLDQNFQYLVTQKVLEPKSLRTKVLELECTELADTQL